MTLIDRARTRYKSLPPPLRRAVGRAAGILPQRLRFGGTFSRTASGIARCEGDPDEALRCQTALLRAQLLGARRQSPFWCETFGAAGIDEAAINADPHAALAGLPILTRQQVRATPEAMLTRPLAALDLVTTSGSSGMPLRFHLDRDRSVTEYAFLLDAWGRAGFRPGDGQAALRGFEIPGVDRRPWEYESGLRELRLSPFHMNDRWLPRYVEEIGRRRIRFLIGYPSAVEILARHVLRAGSTDFGRSIRGLMLTSETCLPHQVEILRRAFPEARLVSFYGQTEKALFAISDPDDPWLFRFNPIYGIAELVDAGGRRITTPGARGRIVGTGLRFRGMPFLRYDTDDEAELVELASARNGHRLAVRNISPRRLTEFLVGRDGELISNASLTIHSTAFDTMRTFMIEQDEPGRARIKAVPAEGHDAGTVRSFVEELGRRTGGTMVFELELVEDIPAGARGKRDWLRQRLDIAAWRDGTAAAVP